LLRIRLKTHSAGEELADNAAQVAELAPVEEDSEQLLLRDRLRAGLTVG
jgi:hypothetical protein